MVTANLIVEGSQRDSERRWRSRRVSLDTLRFLVARRRLEREISVETPLDRHPCFGTREFPRWNRWLCVHWHVKFAHVDFQVVPDWRKRRTSIFKVGSVYIRFVCAVR